jgi:uncharacterized phiE125 gp8 family phage protein
MAFARLWNIAPIVAGLVPLAELKAMCRVDHAEEDDLIAGFGLAAAAHVEKVTQKLLTPRAIVLRMAGLPSGRGAVLLRGGPVAAITSVMVDGAAVSGCAAFGDAPAHMVPAADWPVVIGGGYPVEVTYTAGFTAVPPDLLVAIKIMVLDLYERQFDGQGSGDYAAPRAAASLMEPHRVLAC